VLGADRAGHSRSSVTGAPKNRCTAANWIAPSPAHWRGGGGWGHRGL